MPPHIRLWTTGLNASHADQFDTLASTHSVPLFKSIPGCVGAAFARSASKAYVLTAWIDEASANQASASPTYLEAVQTIGKSGLMTGEQSMEALSLADGFSVLPGSGLPGLPNAFV